MKSKRNGLQNDKKSKCDSTALTAVTIKCCDIRTITYSINQLRLQKAMTYELGLQQN